MEDYYSDIKNYEFKKTIGEGNFAKVKLSIFKPTNGEYAIKIINKNKLKQKMENSIFREIEIISKLKHPNIIKVFKIVEDQENYYIIMEFCQKGELFDYIVKNQNLSENEASIFFYQLINGVEYIHSQNIVHRDLKPENLLLTKNKIIKIIDFGLSLPFDGTKLLSTKCGSPSYAAPEIITNEEYDGFKTDIWSCGVILYVMLCGFFPFGGKNDLDLFKSIIECKPEIPSELSRESKKLLKKIFIPNPNERITIPEIKMTQFYLKGKYLFNIKYDNLNEDNNENLDIIKDNSYDLFEDEDEKEKNINENNSNNKKDKADDNKINIENNNYEEITIVSDDEENDDFLTNNKKNNIKIFDSKKISKKKDAKETSLNQINIYNKENKEKDNKDSLNKIKGYDEKNNIYIKTFEYLENSEKQNNKVQINFNNNLKNTNSKNNNTNNQIFNNFFRKKIINKDLNEKLKQKFENYQKIMKKEAIGFKNDNIKIKLTNQKQKVNKNNIQINKSNNANKYTINNNRNESNKQIMHTIPNITADFSLNSSSKLILNFNNFHNKKNFSNSVQKPKKLILKKSPKKYNYLLTNNNEIKNNISPSFKKFIKNIYSRKNPAIEILNKRKKNNISNNIKSENYETKNLNTIGSIKLNLNNYSKNTKSFEIKKINNICLYKGRQNKLFSPSKTFGQKIIKNSKLIPSINSVKKYLNNKITFDSTPKRPTLFFNNISININTINVNKKRIPKLKLSEGRTNKYKNHIFLSEKKKKEYNKNNNIKYSLKLINEKKIDHNIYSYERKTINRSIERQLNNSKERSFFYKIIKTRNINKNFGKNKLSKKVITFKNSPK